MKKKFLSWFFILTGLMAMQTAMAYDLKVDGIQVTTSNQSNIKPSSLSSGTISFSNNTLTLTDVVMKANSSTTRPLIENTGINKLTILFVGKCKLTGYGSVIDVSKETTISGESGVCAQVEITSERSAVNTMSAAILVRNDASLILRDIHLTATGYHYGITGKESGDNANKAIIKLWSIHLKAVCDAVSGQGAIAHFSTASFTKDDTQLPEGCIFNKTKHGFVDSNGKLYYKFETSNPFMVGNVIVHGSNYSDNQTLKPEGLTAGTIVYDIANKKLTLNGVKWSSSGSSNFITNRRDDALKVVVGGVNTISTYQAGISTEKSLVIEGAVTNYLNNHLTITSSQYNAINASGDSLVVRNMNMTVTGYNAGLYGHETNNTLLSIDRSDIKANATQNEQYSSFALVGRAIAGFTRCTMKEADVMTDYTTFRPGFRAFATDTGNQLNKVEIYVPTTYYDIYILGHQLNNINATCPGIEGLKGTVNYDVQNRKLTLNGVKIQASEPNASESALLVGNNAAKTIELINDNQISAKRTSLEIRKSDVTIQGNGSLTCDGGSYPPVFLRGLETTTNLTINVDNNVSLVGKNAGLDGDNNCTLTLQCNGSNSCYVFNATAPISNINQLTMNGMEISNPGCYFFSRMGGLTNNEGGYFKEEVRIVPIKEYYPIWLFDQQLNNVNCHGVGSRGITGANDAVTFDPSTYTLTIKSARLYHTKNIIVMENTKDVEIHFDGDVTLSNSYETICLNVNTKFTASPDAQVTIASNGYTAILTGPLCQTLAFDGISNMNISGNYGIMSSVPTTQLDLLHSSLSVTGVEEVVSGFGGGINLQGCAISAPAGTKVVDGSFCDANGQVLKGQTLVIGGLPTAIPTLSPDAASDRPYYSLDGRRLDNQPSQKGLYIQNGRKVVVK